MDISFLLLYKYRYIKYNILLCFYTLPNSCCHLWYFSKSLWAEDFVDCKAPFTSSMVTASIFSSEIIQFRKEGREEKGEGKEEKGEGRREMAHLRCTEFHLFPDCPLIQK